MDEDWLLAEDPAMWDHEILLEAYKFLRKEHIKLMDKYDTIFLGGAARCKFCGESLIQDWDHCGECGAKLDQVGSNIQNVNWKRITQELEK